MKDRNRRTRSERSRAAAEAIVTLVLFTGACSDSTGTLDGFCNAEGQCLAGLHCVGGRCRDDETAQREQCRNVECGLVAGFECGRCQAPRSCRNQRCELTNDDAGTGSDATAAADAEGPVDAGETMDAAPPDDTGPARDADADAGGPPDAVTPVRDAGGPPDACSAETDPDFCARLGASCAVVTAVDNCGDMRSVNCGTCTLPQSCAGDCGGTANQCGCCPMTDSQLCATAGATCGSVTAHDGCRERTVSSCGTCTNPQTCGGGGVANACGSVCTPMEKRRCWVECPIAAVAGCTPELPIILGVEECGANGQWSGACNTLTQCSDLDTPCSAPLAAHHPCVSGSMVNAEYSCRRALGASCTTSYYFGYGYTQSCADRCPEPSCNPPVSPRSCDMYCASGTTPTTVLTGVLACAVGDPCGPTWMTCGTRNGCR